MFPWSLDTGSEGLVLNPSPNHASRNSFGRRGWCELLSVLTWFDVRIELFVGTEIRNAEILNPHQTSDPSNLVHSRLLLKQQGSSSGWNTRFAYMFFHIFLQFIESWSALEAANLWQVGHSHWCRHHRLTVGDILPFCHYSTLILVTSCPTECVANYIQLPLCHSTLKWKIYHHKVRKMRRGSWYSIVSKYLVMRAQKQLKLVSPSSLKQIPPPKRKKLVLPSKQIPPTGPSK